MDMSIQLCTPAALASREVPHPPYPFDRRLKGTQSLSRCGNENKYPSCCISTAEKYVHIYRNEVWQCY